MAYIINVTNQSPITIPIGGTDSSTSLTLVGKNVADYGQAIMQDLVDLMQNFADTSAPTNPVDGQLWYDTSVGGLKIYYNNAYKTLSTITSSLTQPTTATLIGDLWWDQTDSVLKIWDGAAWFAIGPNIINNAAAIVPYDIVDSNNISRLVLLMQINSTNVGIISKDEFTPKVTFNGFPVVKAGITLSTDNFVGNNQFYGNLVSSKATITALTAGNVTTTSGGQVTGYLTGAIGANVANTGSFTSITVSGTAGVTGNITAGNVSGTFLTGTLTTGSQTNITSVGTLGSLTVTGNVTAGNVVGTLVTGTLTTASQPNVTTVGTLTTLAVAGNSNMNTVNASSLLAPQIGNAGALLTGTLQTASQTNITSVGTLGTLTVTGNVGAGNVSGTYLTGTLTTASQTNITSVGTLAALTVSGVSTFNSNANFTSNLTVTNTATFNNIANFASNVAIGGNTSITGNLNLASGLTLAGSAGTSGYALISNGAGAAPTWQVVRTYSNIQTFTTLGASTWYKPTGYPSTSPVKVEVWAGGGAGGSVSYGGGGGGYSLRWCKLSDLSATQPVTVGAGATTPGGNGGDSNACSCYAFGGQGFGAGGLGTFPGSNGQVNGDNGYAGYPSYSPAGAGGAMGYANAPGGINYSGAGGNGGGYGNANGGFPSGGAAYPGSGGNGQVIITVFP